MQLTACIVFFLYIMEVKVRDATFQFVNAATTKPQASTGLNPRHKKLQNSALFDERLCRLCCRLLILTLRFRFTR